MSHHTQRARQNQISRTRDLIVATGGLQIIEDQIGVSHFVYYIAEELGCTVAKAREYIQICKMSTIARHRIEALKQKNVAQKVDKTKKP